MKNSVSILLSLALLTAGTPGLVFAQASEEDPPGSNADQDLSPEERAQRVEELAMAGAQEYREGNYETAIRHFKEAYALEPVPNLLYNIAKCYEKQEKYPEAVDYYQEFVVAPEVDSTARKAALDRIDSLREIAELKRDQERRSRESARSDQSGNELFQAADEPEEPVNTVALWTLGGSAVLLAGGLTMGFLASSKADDINEAPTYQERQDAQSSAKTYALVADGLFVAAAAAAGVGLYLYFTDNESDTSTADAQPLVSPWVSSEAAGLGMSLDF